MNKALALLLLCASLAVGAESKIVCTVQTEAPINVTAFWNGFTTYPGAPAQFYKDVSGVVHLSGLVYRAPLPFPGPYNFVVFEIPDGYRPQFDERFAVTTGTGNGWLMITRDQGWVVVYDIDDVTQWISLGGISYRAR